jgi:DNA-binding IclR family transcriptional regulator
VISNAVRRLIAAHIVSVEQLEVLLLLREHRHHCWTVDQVNDRLRSSPSSVGARLHDLTQRGFLAREPAGFRYGAAPAHEQTLRDLAVAYAERRYSVIDLINGR